MKIQLERIDDSYLFEMSNPNSHLILIDNTGRENPKGVSPMETLLMALAGCASIDVISILEKQRQKVTGFKVDVSSERKEQQQAKPFESIRLVFILEGEVDRDKALKAAALSFEKYCSVSMSLNPEIDISWDVIVNGKGE